jgi:DNA-binding NarL/FixJ family response regulator
LFGTPLALKNREVPSAPQGMPLVSRRRRRMASQDPYRIAVVDDHPLMRQGLRKLLDDKEDLQIVVEAGNGLEFLLLLKQLLPDLVILDISMPTLKGIETLRQIKMKYPRMKVLILTMHQEREYLLAAVQAGADGYILKEEAEGVLLSAIDAIRHGNGFISPNLLQEFERSDKPLFHALKFITND